MARHHSYPFKLICAIVAFVFGFNLIVPPPMAHAQMPVQTVLDLPLPGKMIQTTNVYQPPILRGVTINPDNPLQFDFLIDTGEDNIDGENLSRESTKLIKYFLATLTVPEANMWVNLSPFEKDRIIPGDFGLTEMGRDLLAQDYILKQLTASLMYPEDDLGKEFWDRVYKRAQSEFGSTEIPVNTFNKVWIVPEKAEIYVHDQTVYVVNSRLKVMLEQDYLALEHHNAEKPGDKDDFSGVSAQIVREVLIPEIEREVNEGKLFANLRQIYASMILATWYKKNLKESFLGEVYVNKAKTQGIETQDKEINQKIYQQYLQAFKEGVYNYVKEEYDPALDEVVPRKYFSGGVDQTKLLNELQELPGSEVRAQLPTAGRIVSVNAGLRGEGGTGAQNLSYSSVTPTTDAARLTFYQPYRFGEATTLLEGIRYQAPATSEDGLKQGTLVYQVTPEVIQAFRAAFAGLPSRTNHVESLTAIKPLIEAMNQYPLRYKFSRERQDQFKALEDQLQVIPTDGNRRRAIIDQFSSLLNALSDDEVREILNSALEQFGKSLSYDARGFQNWDDITIRLMVNADAPFQMDQFEPGSALAAELKVDLMTLLRGLTNKNFKLYWGMMRNRLIIDDLVRQRTQTDDLPAFLRENPALLKEVTAILATIETNYDLSYGSRASKYIGSDRSPEGKERTARYRNKIYDELAQDRGSRQYVSLFKRLQKFTRIVNTDSGQVRYETDVPARVRAIIEFIAENPELRRKFDIKGTIDETSVTELAAIAQKVQRQQYDPIALSDRKPATTTITTAATPATTARTTTPVYPTQKETVTVRAQELLRERTSTARAYTVSEQVSAYTQPEKQTTGTASTTARPRPKEVRPEDKEENIIYIPLGVTSAQYVDQIKPAVEAMRESRDTGVRTMIFLSHVWPQFLLANANEVGNDELRNLLKTAAGLLDPTVYDIFNRLADLSRDVKKNEVLIRDIERELRNNSFLREQGVYVHLEVLTRWQNRSNGKKDQVSILSTVSYKIDEIEYDTQGQVDTSTEPPSILYLGARIDRIDQDIRALGFTWAGDTFGVVLKDAIKNGAYSGTLPHLFDKPFQTYGQAQAHPLNQLIRTAIQRDYPSFPDQTAIESILDSRYRSTGIHERQHTRDELRGVQRHFSGLGMRIAQETTAYISSIVYGDSPFTDFADVIKLHLNLRDGFGFFSDPNQIYTTASRNILELFAARLGIENFNLDEQHMLDSNAALLEKVLTLNAGQLQALASSIMDEVIDKQSRGQNYTVPKKIDMIESRGAIRVNEGKGVTITTEAIKPVIDILGVLLTKKPKTDENEPSRKKKIYITAAGLIVAAISLSMYGSYVTFWKNDDIAQGINVEQPLEIKRVINPPNLLRDALNLNDADADRYVIRLEDYPRIRDYLREVFNYDARPQDHVLAVRDATEVPTKAGSTLSGISKLFFDDFFNYPAIHSANQEQYGLSPLPDARNYAAVRGRYNLPRGIKLVVPEGIEVEYEVQPGDSLTTIAQRFYGRGISGAQNPLIAWDGVRERWIWERIAEHNGLSLPYEIREGQRLIIPTNKTEYGVNILYNSAQTLNGDITKTTRPTFDKAVLPDRVGGIDLNPNNMEMNDNSGNEIRMNIPLNSQELYNIPVEGFVPVIINITPVSNLPLLLGVAENDDTYAAQDAAPAPATTNERLSYLPR